jgi:hypothetical protein
MSNVEFDTDTDNNPLYSSRTGYGRNQAQSVGSVGMAHWLISHGIINSESGAKTILIGIVCINFIAMGLVLYFFVL